MKKQSEIHLPELDGVRGLACIGVLLAHCLIGIAKWQPGTYGAIGDAWLTARGVMLPHLLGGVDLFFVLSGFLIGGILIDNRDAPSYLNVMKVFWVRRATRILPVAWALVLSYAVALWIRANFDLPAWDLWLLATPHSPLWSYALFIQNFFIALNGVEQPRWIAITWSLAIEEQFYLVFPFVVYFLRHRPLALFAVIGILVAIVLRQPLERYFGNWYGPYIMLVTRMDALLLGVLVTLIVRSPRFLAVARRWRYLLDASMLLAGYLIAVRHPALSWWPLHDGLGRVTDGPFPPLKHTVLAWMYAVFILRIFLYERSSVSALLRNRALGWFGMISYGLYMYHQAVNGVLHAYFFEDEPRIVSIAQLGLSVAVMATAIGLAFLSYRYFETPIRNLGRRARYDQPGETRKAPAMAPAE